MGYMGVFTNPGFVVQTLCFKSHLAFFACMVGEGIYIHTYMCILSAIIPENNKTMDSLYLTSYPIVLFIAMDLS